MKSLEEYIIGDDKFWRAHQAWPILASWARLRNEETGQQEGLITYGHLAKLMGYHHRPIDQSLGVIGQLCLAEEIPCLNAIVVNKSSGKPGHDVIKTKGFSVDQEIERVLQFDWFGITSPSIQLLRVYG